MRADALHAVVRVVGVDDGAAAHHVVDDDDRPRVGRATASARGSAGSTACRRRRTRGRTARCPSAIRRSSVSAAGPTSTSTSSSTPARVERRRAATRACSGSISSVISAPVGGQGAREPQRAVAAERADLEDPAAPAVCASRCRSLPWLGATAMSGRPPADGRVPGVDQRDVLGRRARAKYWSTRVQRSASDSAGAGNADGRGRSAAGVPRPSVAATSTSQSVRSVPSAPAAGVVGTGRADAAPRRPRRPSPRRRRRPTPRARRGWRRRSARRAPAAAWGSRARRRWDAR